MNVFRRCLTSKFAACTLLCALISSAPAQNAPPLAPVREVTDEYFGTKIVDPYRWLEDLKNPEVQRWLRQQDSYTRTLLGNIPERDRILNRIRELDERTPARLVGSLARDRGGNYYYFKMSGSEGSVKGYVRDATGAERLLIDPERFRAQGQSIPDIDGLSPSPDGRYVAFRVGDGERVKLYIMEVKTRRLLGKPVENVLSFSSLGWDSDGESLYYIKLPRLATDAPPTERYLNSSVYRHRAGSDPAEDKLILASGANQGLHLQPTQWAFLEIPPDSKYGVVWVEGDARGAYALYAAPKEKVRTGKAVWWKIADFDDGIVKAEVRGNEIFLLIGKSDAAQRKLFRLPINAKLEKATLIDLPLGEGILTDVNAAADALYVIGREGSSGRLYRVSYDGKVERIELPVEGTVEPLGITPMLSGALFKLSGWTRSSAIYQFQPQRGWLDTGLQQPAAHEKLIDLQVEVVKVRSHDGALVPLTIVYRRGLKRDGTNPAYLTGYGSYGAWFKPFYDNVFLPWYERGGIIAAAHVRGGGEYGEAWHRAGSKDKKSNTWRDFIACAEYLIAEKYTSSAHLAGGGASAGGILIGRAITERPDLFAAALIAVGTTDMLRAEYQQNGPVNIKEFGTVKDKTGFEQLYEMSAFHHVTDRTKYPAVLLTTGMRDASVDVWQPAKMAARLQAASVSRKPVLLRVDPEAGHDQWGSTRRQVRELRADQFAFLIQQLRTSN